ncbi:hypothetical protein HispidOSU_010347, partial [Sigmodon hispidus]
MAAANTKLGETRTSGKAGSIAVGAASCRVTDMVATEHVWFAPSDTCKLKSWPPRRPGNVVRCRLE